MSLTPKQARFVEEYLIDLNATQGAIRAGYSKKTANEQGAQLLAKLSIRQAVAEAQAIRSKRTEITQEEGIPSLKKEADRKSGSAGKPRTNSYAGFCLKKKKK